MIQISIAFFHTVEKKIHDTNNLAAKGGVAFCFLCLMSLFLPGSTWVRLQEKKARQ